MNLLKKLFGRKKGRAMTEPKSVEPFAARLTTQVKHVQNMEQMTKAALNDFCAEYPDGAVRDITIHDSPEFAMIMCVVLCNGPEDVAVHRNKLNDKLRLRGLL